MSLSALIITFNEERNIRRCIESLLPVTDEIIVIDSYSTDRTKEICLSLKVRFIENKWVSYADQKNFGQQQASYDYILSLDADECLTEMLAVSIRKIKDSGILQLYGFNRLTNYCGQWIHHGGWYPDKKIRLYDRRECKWEGTIHEKLIAPASKKRIILKGDCLHYSYYSISEHILQAEHFTTLTANEYHIKSRRSNWLLILFAPCFKFLKDYFLLLGILDGYYGFIISRISAHATFLKYVKLHELGKKNST